MREILVDAPSRLVKSYEQHMVGGEGVLPCCVTPDSSTEPLVNTIRGWGKWWGSEDLESSRGLSKADLVSPGRALCSELRTISPFFLLQTQIGKEGNNNRQESWMNQESHSWQESPHSCLVCFPAPAASPCSVLMLDAVLQEQILFLPPCVVYEPHCWRCAASARLYLQPLAGVFFPLYRLGSEKQGIWQLGTHKSLYVTQTRVSLNSSHSPFFFFFCSLATLLLFPLTLWHTHLCILLPMQ